MRTVFALLLVALFGAGVSGSSVGFTIRVTSTGPVLDQGDLGSCGPCALASLLMHDGYAQPSVLDIYASTRVLDGEVYNDRGVRNKTLFQAVSENGWLLDSDWPYVESRWAERPPRQSVERVGKGRRFVAVPQTEKDLIAAISANRPVLVGIAVWRSFGRSSDVVMPDPHNEQFLGYHDVVLTGYDPLARRFIFKNSWSVDYGDKGYGTLPYEYVVNYILTQDLYILEPLPCPNTGTTSFIGYSRLLFWKSFDGN